VRFLTTAALLLALAFSFSAAAHAAGDKGVEMKARTHFAAGEYKEALDLYARLYAETMHPTYLRNIGRCHQNLGNADKAISSFREYLRKARDLTPEERAEVEGYIKEMEQLKQTNGSSTATAPPPPAAPRTEAPPPAAPPPPEPAPALVGTPTVTASGTRDDDAGPFYTRLWFWGVVAGVAAAGVVTALLLSGGAERNAGDLGGFDLTKKTP
jgi:tetratricopeptide (TPR) repeat protein